jgi:hypothetical protein
MSLILSDNYEISLCYTYVILGITGSLMLKYYSSYGGLLNYVKLYQDLRVRTTGHYLIKEAHV